MPWGKRDWIAAISVWILVGGSISPATAQLSTKPPAPANLPSASPSPPPAAKAAPPEFVVIIDPAHGGDDKGAVFGPRFLEKDVTLSFARAVRRELEQRGIPARMLRDSDVSLTLQHRAEMGNQQHSSVYIALHAGVPGKGVRVYSPLLSAREQAAGRFLAWDNAQAGALERSTALAKAVTRELTRRDLKAVSLAAFLRPLNNVVAPAIAVELAADRGDVRLLENQKLQAAVAAAIASGIAQTRSHPGGRP